MTEKIALNNFSRAVEESGQGYLFSKPLDANSAEELLESASTPKTVSKNELPFKLNVEIAMGEVVYEM